ncbi:MAG: hypothetical protein EPGJADBJ_03630 [Saprospiraceae bacterium]|nr:hypothetical protein [Saprospiraceae bacterium]
MRQQLLPLRTPRIVFPLVEIDIRSVGKSVRAQFLIHLSRLAVRMHTHAAEIGAEAGFHGRAGVFGQGLSSSFGVIQAALQVGRSGGSGRISLGLDIRFFFRTAI